MRAIRDENTVAGLVVEESSTSAVLPVTGADLTNAQPMHVAVVNGSGDQITTFDHTLTSTDVVTVTGGAGQTADVKITLDSETVALSNDSLVGPGDPVIDSYISAAINLAAGANQVLVSSATNKQIWVYGIGFVVNAAGTVSFQDEDDTAITGIMPFAANSGLNTSPSGNFSMPVWKLGTNKDLEVDIVTSELDGFICYAIVSV